MASNLKSRSIVYTRNKRNHEVQTNLPPPYRDICGKFWPFHAHIGKNVSKQYFRHEFGDIKETGTALLLRCRKAHPTGGRCQFAAIYVKKNGYLYARGQHEHSKRTKTPQNVGNDYVDKKGKKWKFNMEIGKNAQREIFINQFGFGSVKENVSGFYLRCRKKINGRCRFAGVYLSSNGCLYTDGKHNHGQMEKNAIVDHSIVPPAKKIPRFSRTLINEKQRQEKGKEKPENGAENLPPQSATISAPFSNNNNATNVDSDSIGKRRGKLIRIQKQCIENARLENRKRMEKIRDGWTAMEKELFLDGLKNHGKNFYAISNSIKTKTVKECVKYYYDTKKIANYKQMLKIKSWWQHREKMKRECRKVMPTPRIQKPAAGRKGKRI